MIITDDAIIRLLKKHPNGMNIIEIAKSLKSNRMTVSKYLFNLLAMNRLSMAKKGQSKLYTVNNNG